MARVRIQGSRVGIGVVTGEAAKKVRIPSDADIKAAKGSAPRTKISK